jgi:uncharacterized protein (TIGR00251 family)
VIPLRDTADGVVFHVRVVPRASKCEAAGFQGDALKLRITAPPVEGKANEALVALVAELFGVKKGQVAILAGHASRAKTVAIAGVKAAQAAALLATLPAPHGK